MRNRFAIPATVLALALAAPVLAEEEYCQDDVGTDRATTPTEQFVIDGASVVHRTSGLEWSRCALGQEFDGRACTGSAISMTWAEARQAVDELNRSGLLEGHRDWRLPTVEELLTIVERCREAPAINPDVFPDTPWTGFWTMTVHEHGERVADGRYEVEHVSRDAVRGAHEDDDEDEDRRDREPEPEAWFVGFYQGLEYVYDMDTSYRIRVVRTPTDA
ncbi:MAG: DUF1566 domain-containing protein [Wenzhouxiangellaceae bacterium]|nr:DUF1566 domain-containing protein [Wenzhouxiangellaceae bacterium]